MNPSMTADLAELDVSDLSLWKDGPPHEVFRELRNQDLHFSALGEFLLQRFSYSERSPTPSWSDTSSSGSSGRSCTSSRPSKGTP